MFKDALCLCRSKLPSWEKSFQRFLSSHLGMIPSVTFPQLNSLCPLHSILLSRKITILSSLYHTKQPLPFNSSPLLHSEIENKFYRRICDYLFSPGISRAFPWLWFCLFKQPTECTSEWATIYTETRRNPQRSSSSSSNSIVCMENTSSLVASTSYSSSSKVSLLIIITTTHEELPRRIMTRTRRTSRR